MAKPSSNEKRYLLGLDIGGTKCAVVLGDARLRIRDRIEFPTMAYRPTLQRLFFSIDELLRRNGLGKRSLQKAGISCGGPLDSAKGLVLSPPNLPGWDRVPIVRLVRQRLGCPARLENDANACAVAEWKFGAGRGCRNLVFLTFGTGLGAGLILGGRLYRGTNDMAGEAGHWRLSGDGPVGYGKRGSFEGFCSGGGIARMAAQAGLKGMSAKTLFEKARQGNKAARAVILQSARHLGQGLSLLIDLLNPERIILGGVYARNERMLRPEVLRVVKREALGRSGAVCRIVPSGLGERIGDVACLAAALMEN